MCQTKYVQKLLSQYAWFAFFQTCSHPNSSWERIKKSNVVVLIDPFTCRNIIGALQYCIMTCTDTSFVVSILCLYLSSPTDVHLKATKMILHYVKGIVDLC